MIKEFNDIIVSSTAFYTETLFSIEIDGGLYSGIFRESGAPELTNETSQTIKWNDGIAPDLTEDELWELIDIITNEMK